MGGCISTYVENEDNLEIVKIDIVKKCMKEIDLLKPKMNGKCKEYFSYLHKLGELVLAENE